MAMSNCSDTGLQGSSKLDGSWMEFIADGPGVAGFRLDVDPETDGDAAAQFLAGADKAQVEEGEVRLNRANDWAHIDSLEALEGIGMEFADSDAAEAVMAFEDADADEEDEGAIAALDPKYLRERPVGAISTYRSAEVAAQVAADRRQGSPVFGTAAIHQKAVEAARLISKVIVAEEKRKASATAKPEPRKGNGNGHKSAPPVGKFLRGTVVDHGPKGMLVELPNGAEVRIAVVDEYGHGSQTAALKWLHSHAVGTRVRLRVKYVNGAIYGVLTYEKHPRPQQCRQPVAGKEINQQVTEEARPAN